MPRGIYDRNTKINRLTSSTAARQVVGARRRRSAPDTRSTSQDRAIAPQTTPVTTDDQTEVEEPVRLSSKLVRMVDGIRQAFSDFADDYAVITRSREEFAPKFMKVCHAWQAETEGSFVEFVRVLVPDLPMETKGYKAHTAYAAADYLRRKVAEMARENTTPAERAARIASAPVNPRQAMARVLASILPLIDATALATLWGAMESQLHWSANQVKGMQALVADETPLVRVRAPRGVKLDHQLKLTTVQAVPDAEDTDETITRTRTA